MEFGRTGRLTTAIDGLRGQVESLRNVRTKGALSSRFTRGVSWKMRQPQMPSTLPQLLLFTDIVEGFLICQPFSVGNTEINSGATTVEEVYYAVQAPQEFSDSSLLQHVDLPESRLVDRTDVTFGPESLTVQATVKHLTPQLRVIQFPDRTETVMLTSETRQRTLTQLWWPMYRKGYSRILAAPIQTPFIPEAPEEIDPAKNSAYFYAGQSVIHGFIDMNTDARRWTNHRDIADDAVVRIPPTSLAVVDENGTQLEVQTGSGGALTKLFVQQKDQYGEVNDLKTKNAHVVPDEESEEEEE